MYSVSEKYSKAIVADTRDMLYRVTLAGKMPLTQSEVPNMTLTESASGNSSIAIGTSNSASLTLTLKNADVIDYNDMLVEPESGLVLPDGTIEWVPLGKFWVTNSSTNDDYRTVTLTCADGMYHLTDEFESNLTYPTTLKAFVGELNAKTGVEFVDVDSLPSVIIRRKPEGATYREAYGYAAGCCGKNARFNRSGKMEFYWYTETGVTVERESQYLNGMTRLNDKPLDVEFKVVGNEETFEVTCISDGSGGVSATPGRNVLEGETVVLTINPFAEYELAIISAITESGNDVTLYKDSEGGYTFIQPDSNVTVTASFRKNIEGPFNLTVRSYEGGNVSANKTTLNKDEIAEVHVIVDNGFELDKFVTTPARLNIEKASTEGNETLYKFAMPQSDVTITAYFKEAGKYYNINYSVDVEEASTTPGYVIVENRTTPGSVYKKNDIISVFFAESQGYAFDRYESTVEMIQFEDNEYRFTMPENDVSITAFFKRQEANDNEVAFALQKNAPENAKQVTISYSNPIIYEKMVSTISKLVQGVAYTPAKVKHRGNPAFQTGDIVSVPDRNGIYHTVLIMQQTMTFGGGMNSEFTSFGQTEAQSKFSANGPITTQIKQAVKQSSDELEHKVSSNNALVFSAIHKTLGNTQAKIESIVEWQTEKASSIAKTELLAKENEAKISDIVAWKGSLDVANANIIKNSSGANFPSITPNTLMISSTNFAICSWEIESEALTVTEDENTVYITSDNIFWGDGTFFATPRTDRVMGKTNYTISFEVIPDKNLKSIDVTWFSDTEDNRKAGDGYVNSTSVGTAMNLIAEELQLFTFTFMTNPDDFMGYLKFTGDGGTFKISKIKMELGSDYTGWVPYGGDTISSIASIERKVNENEAGIMAQAELETQLAYSLSKIEQRVNENEASIEMKVTLNDITGEFVIKAINDDKSLAKINADNIEFEGSRSILIEAINKGGTVQINANNILFEGQKLNIKVDATNIEGDVEAKTLSLKPENPTVEWVDEVRVDEYGIRIWTPLAFINLSHGVTLSVRDNTSDKVMITTSDIVISNGKSSFFANAHGFSTRYENQNCISIGTENIVFGDGPDEVQLNKNTLERLLELLDKEDKK